MAVNLKWRKRMRLDAALNGSEEVEEVEELEELEEFIVFFSSISSFSSTSSTSPRAYLVLSTITSGHANNLALGLDSPTPRVMAMVVSASIAKSP